MTLRSLARRIITPIAVASGWGVLHLVEDSDQLGYRAVCHPLLDVMDAEEWYELERAAMRDADDAG